MHRLVLALGTLRAPIVVALLAIAFIALPEQARETFLAIREAEGRDLFLAGQAALLALVFAASLGLSSLGLLQTATEHRRRAVDDHRRLLEALAFALPLAALTGLAAAFVEAGSATSRPIIIFGAAAVVALAVVLLLVWYDGLRARLVAMSRGSVLFRIGHLQGIAITAAVTALVIAFVVGLPRPFALALGPLGVVFLFLAILCVAYSLLGYVYDRHQVPTIGILIVLAALWAFLQWNDNHHIRLADRDAPPAPAVDVQFREWLLARPDLDDYRKRGRPYPVYIVSAEGGGLYAAAHTAWWLAFLQDGCPAFARHVFAISSVSGGSVGAALFSALVKAHPPSRDLKLEEKCLAEPAGTGPLQKAVREFFEEDLLTPLLAAGLFPDFFQRFWPLPIAAFDRARALEGGFERAWHRALKTIVRQAPEELRDLFGASARALWSAKEDQPALLLHTTLVHSGERVIIAPFKLIDLDMPLQFHGRRIDLLNMTDAPRLAAAVGASASFPWISPPARYFRPKDDREGEDEVQLVDGGFFENSGVFSAMDLIGRLRSAPITLPQHDASGVQPSGAGCDRNNAVLVKGSGRRPDSRVLPPDHHSQGRFGTGRIQRRRGDRPHCSDVPRQDCEGRGKPAAVELPSLRRPALHAGASCSRSRVICRLYRR